MPEHETASRDRLTILRLLLLTAGVAIGLVVWGPGDRPSIPLNTQYWQAYWNAVLLGLALPAPLFTVRFPAKGVYRLGPGRLFALTAALGAYLMMPPTVAARFTNVETAVVCSFYVFPLMALWYMMAATLGGQLNRSLLSPETPWSERYGFLLGILWSPLGLCLLADLYLEALRI